MKSRAFTDSPLFYSGQLIGSVLLLLSFFFFFPLSVHHHPPHTHPLALRPPLSLLLFFPGTEAAADESLVFHWVWTEWAVPGADNLSVCSCCCVHCRTVKVSSPPPLALCARRAVV